MNDKKVEDRYKTRSKNSSDRGYASQRGQSDNSRQPHKNASQWQYAPSSRDRDYEYRAKVRRKSRFGCLVSILLLIIVLAGLYILIFHSPLFNNENEELSNSPVPSFTEFVSITPTPTLKPGATEIPTPTPEPMSSIGYITTEDEDGKVRMRSEPNGLGAIVGEIYNRETLYLLGKEGDYYKINYRGEIAYVYSDYVVENLPEDNMLCNVVTHEIGYSKLVDVTEIIPDLIVEMPYATSSNHVNKQMYPFELVLLQETTAYKLKEAQELFLEDGYCLVIWDAYRPYNVTRLTFQIIQDTRLAASPETGSKHNRGAAVDITLFDLEKNDYVNLPTEVREMDYDLAKRSSKSMTAEQRENMEYMERIMGKAGFEGYSGEWWHYNDMETAKYPVLDIQFEAWAGATK